MEKDAIELSNKVTEHGVVRMINHVLASNVRSLIELAMVRGLIAKFEVVFKSQEGKDATTLSVEIKGMKKVAKDLKVKIIEKDNQINDL